MSKLGVFYSVCKRGHDMSKTRYFVNGKSKGCRECNRVTSRALYESGEPPYRRAARLKWVTNHPKEHAINKWKYFIKKNYGLSLETYNDMVIKQHNRCAICGDLQNHSTHKRLHIDHNHTTGKVRSLLCSNCNSAVAHVKEDPMRAYRVATYLQKHI